MISANTIDSVFICSLKTEPTFALLKILQFNFKTKLKLLCNRLELIA